MKKVLIITYYWPPSGGSGVQRWTKFAKYLPSLGWQCVVYTPENPEMPSVDHSLEADIPKETIVIKRHITEIYSIYRSLTGRKSSTKEVNPINHQKKSLLQRGMMFLRGNCFIPDPRVSWVRPSTRFLVDYLRENPVDVIVSTGPPQSMHLIGRNVSLATGIPWVADFRDPWTRIFYFKHLSLSGWAQRKHCRLEQQVLDDATRVVAVSPLVQDEFREMTSTPVSLITNGFDEQDFSSFPEPDGFFNLTHTGLFASDGNPEALWRVLARLCGEDREFSRLLRIRLVGKNDTQILDSIRGAGLGDNLVDRGYQSHDVAVAEQKNATILALPLRKEPEYRATLPGKLFEYLGSRRPVLGIGQTDGAMARVLADTGAGETFEWEDEKGIEIFIRTHWKKYLSGERDFENTQIERYSRSSTTRQMAALLEEVSHIKRK